MTTKIFYSEQTSTRNRRDRFESPGPSPSPPPLYSLLNLPGENKAEKPLKCPVRIPYNLWVPLYSNEMQDSSLQQGETIIKVIKVRFTSDSKNFYHNLWFSNPYIVATRCRRPFIFKHMYSVGSNNQRLKYHSSLYTIRLQRYGE